MHLLNLKSISVTLVEMSRTIKKLEMHVKYDRPNVLVPEEACSGMICLMQVTHKVYYIFDIQHVVHF